MNLFELKIWSVLQSFAMGLGGKGWLFQFLNDKNPTPQKTTEKKKNLWSVRQVLETAGFCTLDLKM